MSDPWEEIQVTTVVSIPLWMVDWAKVEYDDPSMTAEQLVSMWVENMQENTYDVARDDGTLPVPILQGEDVNTIPSPSTEENSP